MDSVALRAAFDRLPICIARKVNALIDGLGLAGEEGATVAELLATGLFEGHSLEDLFGDISSGRFAAYLKFEDGERLADKAARWEALHGEAVKRLFETDALYAERAGVTVGIPYGEEPQPYTVPLRGDGGELEDVARHDASDTSHADLRKRLAEVERETALRSRARVFDTWEDALLFCTAFDEEEAKEAFSVGDRLLIRDGEVPDGWVSGFAKAAMPYPGGNGIREPFDGDTAVTVGWVILSPLEGPKVDLSEYVTRTEAEEKIGEVASALSEKKADRSALARLEARVENLRANVAPEYFVTDAAAAYVKTVPDAALPFAEVKEVGGMTYAEGGTLQNAAVTALESVGVNILDISAALNSCLTDNGDGTYTITRKTSSDRFSATFPLYIPVNGRIYAYVEIVTSYDGFNGSIPLQIFGEDGKTEIGAASLANNGSGFALANGSHYARLYLNTNAPIGVPVTFRKPMVKYGTASAPYAPYVKRTYPIPAEVQALDGWGEGISADCHNRIDWEKKQYRQEVRRIRLDGSEEWKRSVQEGIFQASTRLPELAGNTKAIRPILSSGYGFSDWYVPDASAKPYFRIAPNGDSLWIEATVDQFASVDAWKAYLAEHPVEILYPLASPTVTDLPELPDDNFIGVEGGGSVTAVNEGSLAAPTKIEYQLKEATA